MQSNVSYTDKIEDTDRKGANLLVDLRDPERQLFHEGKMMLPSRDQWINLHVFLFDHLFVVTTIQDQFGQPKYITNRRPIPLELLQIISFTEGAYIRGTGLRLQSLISPSKADLQNTIYPITLRHLGRDGVFTLYVSSETAREEWKRKLQEAMGYHKARSFDSSEIFQCRRLGSRNMEEMSLTEQRHSEPLCSVPFDALDGRKLLAIGYANGLWVGSRNDTSVPLIPVIHTPNVTHCAVLPEIGLLLVLADKILMAYPFENVVPSISKRNGSQGRTAQRLSGKQDVDFFRIGRVGGRILLVYVKKHHAKESSFKVLEPTISLDTRNASGSRFLHFGTSSSRSDYFKMYKEFVIPSQAFSIQFLQSQLAISSDDGVRLINVETLKALDIPEISHVQREPEAAALRQRCNDSVALAVFRLEADLLLVCFKDFAFWANMHGEPISWRHEKIIIWEGTPMAVAYQEPYVLAFDPSFIEVRHAHTGKRVQVIQGHDIRCTYHGISVDAEAANASPSTPKSFFPHPVLNRASSSPLPSPGLAPPDGTEPFERKIHVSMIVDGVQTVFELDPTTDSFKGWGS